MSRRNARLTGAVAVASAAVVLLGACGGEPSGSAEFGSDSIAPSDSSDGQVHEAGPITVTLPEGWTEAKAPTAAEGTDAWAFTDGVAAEGENTNGLTIVVSHDADNDMLTQIKNSLTSAEKSMSASDGATEAVKWPEASDAAYSTYFVTLPMGSDDGDKIRFESLGVVNQSGDQAFVLVYGPDATYDADGVHHVLESVKLQ